MASPVHVEKETQMEPVQGKFSIMVDLDLCQGHSTCVGEAPELFRVNEAGKVEVLSTDPAPELLQKARMAEKYCPNRVIRIQRIE